MIVWSGALTWSWQRTGGLFGVPGVLSPEAWMAESQPQRNLKKKQQKKRTVEKKNIQEIWQGNHDRAAKCKLFPQSETSWVSLAKAYQLSSAVQVFWPSQDHCHKSVSQPVPPAYWETPEPWRETLPHRWTYKPRGGNVKWWPWKRERRPAGF